MNSFYIISLTKPLEQHPLKNEQIHNKIQTLHHLIEVCDTISRTNYAKSSAIKCKT